MDVKDASGRHRRTQKKKKGDDKLNNDFSNELLEDPVMSNKMKLGFSVEVPPPLESVPFPWKSFLLVRSDDTDHHEMCINTEIINSEIDSEICVIIEDSYGYWTY